VSDLSWMIRTANVIISVHGSGLSNIAFASRGSKIIDILAPYHQDCYYWLISNQKAAKYIGFFSEGDHPNDDDDLVKLSVDKDLLIDIPKLKQLLERELLSLE
ncbi:MAG TPA: hypothetical protein VF622_12480, partial [Segetibacter sp.]